MSRQERSVQQDRVIRRVGGKIIHRRDIPLFSAVYHAFFKNELGDFMYLLPSGGYDPITVAEESHMEVTKQWLKGAPADISFDDFDEIFDIAKALTDILEERGFGRELRTGIVKDFIDKSVTALKERITSSPGVS